MKKLHKLIAESTGFYYDKTKKQFLGKRGSYDLIVKETEKEGILIGASLTRNGYPVALVDLQIGVQSCTAIRSVSAEGSVCWFEVNLQNGADPAQQLAAALNYLPSFFQGRDYQNVSLTPAGDGISASLNKAPVPAKPKKENFPLGLLGAILGSLVGAAVIILVNQMEKMPYVVAFCPGVVMVVATVYGYMKLGKVWSKKAVFFSLVLMVLMTYLGERMAWAVAVASYLKLKVMDCFRAIPSLVSSGIIPEDTYYTEMAKVFAIMIITAVIVFLSMRKERK